jgi:nucleoside triphosphate diphosphatase
MLDATEPHLAECLEPSVRPSRDIAKLVEIMAALRTPKTGCPWDLEQSFETIVPYTIEEAYEVAEAVLRGDLADLKDELGDLLLQVVFHARMAEEQGAFAFPDVVEAITEKLIRRHPHVFGDRRGTTAADVKGLWAKIKGEEREKRRAKRAAAGLDASPPSLLDDVPLALPALSRAETLQRRVVAVGFDWPDTAQVIDKIREELAETEAALKKQDRAELADEIGDLLFTVANLARHAGIDAEDALRATNRKFERRFRFVEGGLAARGKAPAQSSLDEMEALWQDAKAAEREQVSAPASPPARGA